MQRQEPLTINENYHIFNRGVEKRIIFKNSKDYFRFIESIIYFNTEIPTRMLSEEKSYPKDDEKLVDVITYCLNPNHFHFILRERKENGIATFMKKICTGYAMYFNKKYERSGVLFQGRFKSVHIESDDLFLYLSAYVNCNSQIHGIANALDYKWCSFSEYIKKERGIGCQKNEILKQFKNIEEYKKFCMEKVIGMKERKNMLKFLIEN